MKSLKLILTLVSGVLISILISVPAFAIDPTGVWLVKQEDGDRTAHVQVSKCGPTLCNEIIWLSSSLGADGQPITDNRNVNTRLRSRPILGLTILLGMRQKGNGTWHGHVYSPERGQVFSSKLAMASPKELKVTGCMKVAFIPVCQTRIWTRVQK